jgi:hypothetical protein
MYISRCGTTFYEESFENYKFLDELDIDSGYIYAENPLIETVDNVKVCIYTCNKPFTLEQAEQAIIDKYFGSMSVESQDYGYSEYTIEGFNIYSIKIGNHNLLDILNENDKYKIVTIEKVKKSS